MDLFDRTQAESRFRLLDAWLARQSDKAWDRAQSQYQQHLERVYSKLAPSALIFKILDFHDCRIMLVKDDIPDSLDIDLDCSRATDVPDVLISMRFIHPVIRSRGPKQGDLWNVCEIDRRADGETGFTLSVLAEDAEWSVDCLRAEVHLRELEQ